MIHAQADNGPVLTHLALSPPRSATGRTPKGYRVLHVLVPERIFNHAKAQAYLSGMRFSEYIARFLEEAWPYTEQRLPPATMAAPAQPPVPPEVVGALIIDGAGARDGEG